MEMEKIAQALVKIQDNANNFVTGFLFTDFGHILSVGHFFSNNSSKLGQKFYVHFENDNLEKFYEAILEKFEFDERSFIDFGILRITSKNFIFENRSKLIIERFKRDFAVNKKINIYGYTSILDDNNITEFQGVIVNTKPVSINQRNNYWMHLRMDTGMNLLGLSGSPVLLDGKVIGIQCRQANYSEFLNRDSFANVISCIDSEIVKTELNKKFYEFYFKPELFGVHLKAESSLRIKRERNVLLIYDYIDDNESQIANNLKDIEPLELFNKKLDESIKEFRKLTKNSPPKVTLRIISLFGKNEEYLNDEIESLNNQFTDFHENLRCIIDFGGYIAPNEKISDAFRIKQSHLIGLNFIKSLTNEIKIGENINYDVNLNIQYCEEEFLNEAYEKIISGILMDIAYFWSIPGLNLIFCNTISQRALSLRKIQFARMENLKIFTNLLISPNSEYISFAWLSYSFHSGKFDLHLYHRLWQNFLIGEGGLFSKIVNDQMPLSAMTAEEITLHIIKTNKLSRQVSRRKLRSKIDSTLNNTLSAIVILGRRPKSKKEKDIIETLFNRKKLKSFEIVPFERLRHFMGISHLLTFYYFIKNN